jgi:ATP-dependent protease Clp ATPase subunit
MSEKQEPYGPYQCVFCEKGGDEVKYLIAAPKGNIFICDECVETCHMLLQHEYRLRQHWEPKQDDDVKRTQSA